MGGKALQLEGRRFCSLVVKEKAPIRKDSRKKDSRWLCICDCGKETEVFGFNLVSGKTKHCRECGYKAGREKLKLRLQGKRFGFLSVLKEITEPKDRRTVWLCQCDCGKQIKVTGYKLTSDHTHGCQECGHKRAGSKRKDGEL